MDACYGNAFQIKNAVKVKVPFLHIQIWRKWTLKVDVIFLFIWNGSSSQKNTRTVGKSKNRSAHSCLHQSFCQPLPWGIPFMFMNGTKTFTKGEKFFIFLFKDEIITCQDVTTKIHTHFNNVCNYYTSRMLYLNRKFLPSPLSLVYRLP